MVKSVAIIYLLELSDLGSPLSVVGSQDAVKKNPSFLIYKLQWEISANRQPTTDNSQPTTVLVNLFLAVKKP